MARIIHIALRGAEFFWTIVIMALVGNMLESAFAGNPPAVNFTMVVVAFTMASLIYLIPTAVKEGFGVPIITIALDAINTLLFFIAGVVLAAKLGVKSCTNEYYLMTNSITNGSFDMEKRCHEAQASTAFLWFGFVTFAVSTVLSYAENPGSVKVRGVGAGGIRRGGPSMSQV